MKHEWRKQEKNIYLPKSIPTIADIPKMKYFTIEGKGNPNKDEFGKLVASLYALSYTIKMAPKNGIEIENYFDYTVYPLEGVWDLNDEGISLYKSGISIKELKDYFVYKLMIRQPNFVSEEQFVMFKDLAFKKKKNDLILDVKFEMIEDGKSCQMLHLGSYDSESESFEMMEKFCKEKGYYRVSKIHREIYISDPRRVSSEKLKTTLRFKIEKDKT